MLRFLSLLHQTQHRNGGVLLWLLMGLLLSSGCMVGPDYSGPPCPPAPREWTQNRHDSVKPEVPALDDWWLVFDDPVLNTILANVNEQNLSLRAAAWQVYQARAALCATRGDLFPALGTDGSYTLLRGSGDGVPRGNDLVSSTWSWGASASWELDIFGQIKRYIEAAEAEVEASEDDYRNVKMILMADTVRTYIDARLYQERMEIIRANILQQRDFLRIIESRFQAGKDDRLAYAQAVANLNSVEASYPSMLSSYRESLNRLSVLMGTPPGTVDEIMQKVEPIPVAPDAIAVSIPADILRRRPDIRSAERRLAAQTARIGIAEAEKYPKFFINGSFGLQAEDFGDLFNGRSITASVMPSFQWRLLEFGRIRCTIMQQEGLTEQMRYEYQQLVLEAAEEVDNAISNYVRIQQRVQYLEEAVLQYRDALQLSEKLYAAGRNNYLPVLDSQRSVLEYEELLAIARANLSSSVVQIYRALGGGWQIDPVASSTTQQIDRFRNRYPDSAGPTSSPGEGVNAYGSVGSRALPPEIGKSSQRSALATTRVTLTEAQQQEILKGTRPVPKEQETELMPEMPSSPGKYSTSTDPATRPRSAAPTPEVPTPAPATPAPAVPAPAIPTTDAPPPPAGNSDPLLEGLLNKVTP
ncbi:MAG: efflux transporter outer membrane subunit [Planctomycetia bacterium]|nr:efflux transporter outer membrane subunit [Planctomycetia bacterium]